MKLVSISGQPKPVISVKPNRNLLLQIHAEYTSITDELESVCHMIASPTTSLRGEYRRQSYMGELQARPEVFGNLLFFFY